MFGLSFDSYLDIKKRQLILSSLKNDESVYDLSSEEDIEFLKKIIRAKQFNMLSYRIIDESEIGGFAPIVMMHDEKQT